MADHHAQPDRIQPHGHQYRPDDRHHNEGDFDEVQHETQQEHHQHDNDHRADHAAGQVVQQAGDLRVAAEPPEYQAEQRGADEDHEHHGGYRGGAVNHRAYRGQIELALLDRQAG